MVLVLLTTARWTKRATLDTCPRLWDRGGLARIAVASLVVWHVGHRDQGV
jgi:hypothetical protein